MKTLDFHLDYKKKRLILAILSIFILVSFYFFKSASFTLRAVSTIAVMTFFYATDHFYNIKFRKRHYFFMIMIVIMSFLASPLYYIYPNYDKLQHFIQPMFTCSLVFYMINKLHLELKWKIAFTFLSVVAILGIFEIGEFGLDSLFDLKLQGVYVRDMGGFEKFNLMMDPLKDTMIDMAFGIFGSGIWCSTFAISMKKKLNINILKEF